MDGDDTRMTRGGMVRLAAVAGAALTGGAMLPRGDGAVSEAAVLDVVGTEARHDDE
jgi:hypothetical protein